MMAVQCDECSQKLNDSAELAVHLKQQHQKTYCGVCKKEFKSIGELKSHVEDDHGKIHNA
jgi:hypothetical protein